MTEMLLTDYFYGDESEQFSYFRIPRLLITSPRFKGLSTDAKLLYGMLLDRMSLSAKNGWYDEQSRVYIYYTADEIRADMGCGNDKALKLLSELDTKKGVGLIERIKQGQGKPTKIYVKRFTTRELPADTAESSPPCPDTGRGADLDFSDFQTSEKSMSRPRQTRCADLGKADASYHHGSQDTKRDTQPQGKHFLWPVAASIYLFTRRGHGRRHCLPCPDPCCRQGNGWLGMYPCGGTYCCRRLFSLQRHDLWRICVRLCQVTNSLCARARFCLREFLLYRIGSKGA